LPTASIRRIRHTAAIPNERKSSGEESGSDTQHAVRTGTLRSGRYVPVAVSLGGSGKPRDNLLSGTSLVVVLLIAGAIAWSRAGAAAEVLVWSKSPVPSRMRS